MILEIITCEKPQRRHVFTGVTEEDLVRQEDGTWVMNINTNGTIKRVFINPVYFTWYEDLALPKLNFDSVHCQNIFHKAQ